MQRYFVILLEPNFSKWVRAQSVLKADLGWEEEAFYKL